MVKLVITCLLTGVLTACAVVNRAPQNMAMSTAASVGTDFETPTEMGATLSPQSISTTTSTDALVESCSLLNTHDLASLFTSHTETILPKPQINPVDHPIFWKGITPGMETSCVYYTFHLPGSHAEVVLQVNYWLDSPASSTADQAWTQDWSVASTKAAQILPDIANGAFYKDGRLSFKQENLYITVEAIETDWNLNGSADMNKQLEVEKQIAFDVLHHLQ